jgi:hypothetical protein
VEGVHYQWAELGPMMQRYPVERLQDGWNTDIDGEPFYFIRNPALGLWAAESRLARAQ